MSYEIFKTKLKTNNLPHLMHFYGEETYMLMHSLSAVKRLIVGDTEEFNLIAFEGDITVDDIDVAVNTPPFFGEKKLLVLKETGLFKNGAPNREIWKTAFSDVADFLYIVACESNFDKRNTAYKTFAENALSVNFEKRDKSEIRSWISKLLAKKGKIMANDAIAFFVDSVGVDMNTVSSQLEKLVSYVGDRREIAREDVEKTVTKEFFTKEYVLTDALLGRKKKDAVRALGELLEMRNDPIMLLFVIASSYMSTYKAKLALRDGVAPAQVAKILHLPHPFLAKKYTEFAKRNDEEYLSNAIELLTEADSRVKAGLVDPKTCIQTIVAEL